MKFVTILFSLFLIVPTASSYALDPGSILFTCSLIHNNGPEYMRFSAPLTKCGTDTFSPIVIGKGCVNAYHENRQGNFGFVGQGVFTPDGFGNYQVARLYLGLTKVDSASVAQPTLTKVAYAYATGIKVTVNPFSLSASVSDNTAGAWRYTTATCMGQLLFPISR